MGRRNRASTVEKLIKLLSWLPWWVTLILAAASYFALHALANHFSSVQSAVPGQIGVLVLSSFVRTFAQVGKYVVPLILLSAAVMAIFRQRKMVGLFTLVNGNQGAAAISGMSWREFELLIAEGFRQRGFSVSDKGGEGPDGGIDLVLKKGGEKFLVQCKQWRASKVGVTVVRELYGVMSAEAAVGGFVVTSGVFTAQAEEFAAGRNIELMDGQAISKWLAPSQEQVAKPLQVSSQFASRNSTQACPQCGAEMRVRKASKGPSAGHKFLGCSRYPTCRGTRPL